jgi:MFS family permease
VNRPASTRQNPLTVLENTQFRLLFLGTTLSMLAFGMMQVVQGVVAFDLTGKNGSVGFVYLGQGFAMLILSPIGGTLSDRVSKKKMLTAAQFVIGVMFGVVAVLFATDMITIMLLAGGALVLGCMFSMMGPTRQAWVGDLLVGEEMAKGVALQQLMMNVTRIVGPLTAGVLIATRPIGTSGTYFVMAALFGAVVLTLMLMEPTPPRKRAVQTSVRTDLFEGFRYIWRTPDVRLLAFVFVGVVLSAFTYQTIMPGYLVNTLDHPANHLGFLFTATAVGGILVNVWLAARPARNSAGLMLFFGAGLAVSLALMGAAPGFVPALAAAAFVGVSSSGFQMLNNVNLMERTDSAYLGRVMSVTMMAFGVNSIASYPVGLIADSIGERATLFGLSGACLTVVMLGVLAMRSNLARSARLAEPSLSTPPAA